MGETFLPFPSCPSRPLLTFTPYPPNHTGGGAVEAALSVFLENFATTLGSREQLAIGEFANAALVLPKTLAVNAAKDATELIAALRAFHYKAQTSPDSKQVGGDTPSHSSLPHPADSRPSLPHTYFPPFLPPPVQMAQFGLDLVEGKVRNNVEAGVLEPSMSKVKMIQFATEAAITILRIDDLIRLAPNPEDQEG